MFRFLVLAACVLLVSCAEESLVTVDGSANVIAEEGPPPPPLTDQSEIDDGIRSITQLNGTYFKCPIHEEFIDCPEAHKCQLTCTTLNQACVVTPTCSPGCFCRQGFARDANGRCVPIRDCPGTACPRNEEFIVCDDTWKCEKSCVGRNAECPATAFCAGGCQCQEGHYRDTNGACVRAHSCVAAASNLPCPRNQIWRTCQFDCLDQCVITQECIDSLPTATCRAGCFCETGHSRQGDRCVPAEKCLRK